MTRWCDRTACRSCPRRKDCPPEYRKRKKAKAARDASVSKDRIARAAKALRGTWLTPYELGCAVMRVSIANSGLRVLRRMEELGFVQSIPGPDGKATYRLSADGEEAFGCAAR